MKKILAALSIAVVLAVAVTGCEPAMTITAKNKPSAGAPDDGLIGCQDSAHIVGKVAPPTATGAVQLQRTVGGKWTDVKGQGSWSSFTRGTPATARRAAVNQTSGAYAINFYPASLPVETPLHFRVRSNAGTAFSPSFYLTVEFC